MEVTTKALASPEIWNITKDKLPEPLVIGRNDGLPVRLDDITFSKWREGSISGFGNAIHPGVALQIFKTIEQFEQIFMEQEQ
jgi:DNA (cytosine-5)-methyltransferase 1